VHHAPEAYHAEAVQAHEVHAPENLHSNAAQKAAAKKAAAVRAPGPKKAAVQGYSVGMDFTVNTAHMYGLPQRADNFRLEDTGFDHPYRLFN
jgi:hypothetical protein